MKLFWQDEEQMIFRNKLNSRIKNVSEGIMRYNVIYAYKEMKVRNTSEPVVPYFEVVLFPSLFPFNKSYLCRPGLQKTGLCKKRWAAKLSEKCCIRYFKPDCSDSFFQPGKRQGEKLKRKAGLAQIVAL
jgi:hypothetical protein